MQRGAQRERNEQHETDREVASNSPAKPHRDAECVVHNEEVSRRGLAVTVSPCSPTVAQDSSPSHSGQLSQTQQPALAAHSRQPEPPSPRSSRPTRSTATPRQHQPTMADAQQEANIAVWKCVPVPSRLVQMRAVSPSCREHTPGPQTH